MKHRLVGATTALLLVATLTHVAEAAHATPTPQQGREVVAPFIDDQTVAVAYVNLNALEPDALMTEIRRMELPQEIAEGVEAGLLGFLDALRQGGLVDLYIVVSTDYLLANPVALVAPLAGEADPEAVGQLLAGVMHGFVTDLVHGAVVAAEPYALERIRESRAVRPPELEAAFEAAGGTPVWLAVIPTDDNRRVIEETMPVLPEELGGGPSTVLTQGVRWLLVSATLPPEPTVRLVAKSEGPRAALALKDWLEEWLLTFPQRPEVRKEVPQAERVASMVRPQVRGNQVLVPLEADTVRDVVALVVHKTEAEARVGRSLANLHKVGIAIAMYRADHEKEWPENLNQLVEGDYADPEALRNPRRPGLEVGYMYRKPAKDATGRTVLAWGRFEEWPDEGVNVLFVDMAVLTVRDRDQFDRMLQSGR